MVEIADILSWIAAQSVPSRSTNRVLIRPCGRLQSGPISLQRDPSRSARPSSIPAQIRPS